MLLEDFKTFAQENNLTYYGKMVLAYGKYQGYDMIIRSATEKQLFIIEMVIDCKLSEQAEEISQYLLSLSKLKPYVKFASFDKNTILINVKSNEENVFENLRQLLDEIVSYCRTNCLVSCCKFCRSQLNLGAFSINGSCVTMCDDCFEKAKAGLLATQHENKDNKVTGIVGALLGSLIGVVLWVIVYQLGYIAGIVGLVMAVCCMKGYEIFGGKLDIWGISISLLIAVVMLYFAENVAVALQIFNEFKTEYEITFFDAFKAIPKFLQDEDAFRSSFIKDLVIGLLLMMVASFRTIASTYSNSNVKHEMSRLA